MVECLEPGVVKPEDLVAYAAGEADSLTAAHIAACSACMAQAASYAEMDRRLRSSLFRIDCLPAQTLGELALELLDPQDTLRVRSHLAHCPHCRDELTTLVSALQGDPLADLSPTRSWLQRVVARLVPPPTLQPATVRGAGSGPSLTYQSGELTISLTVEPDRQVGHWRLLGSVLDEAGHDIPSGTEVRLQQGERIVSQTALDEWGLFTVAALQAGRYDLELALPDRVMAVEDIELGGGTR